jgi:hypothetical protein
MPLMNDPSIWFKELFVHDGLSYSFSTFLSTVALVLIAILVSWVSNLIAKAVILKIITRIIKKPPATWDDIFLEQKVFTRLSHLAPALVIWFMAAWALKVHLKQHLQVEFKQTVIMRHRPTEGNGLSMEAYLFTKSNQFVPYENIQYEIFEQLLKIMSEFGLKIFQQPTGDNLQTLSIKKIS